MADDKPAPAEPKSTPKASPIKGASLTRIRDGKTSHPAITFDGDKPRKGSTVEFYRPGGQVWTGTATDVVDADGNVLVEFGQGIALK